MDLSFSRELKINRSHDFKQDFSLMTSLESKKYPVTLKRRGWSTTTSLLVILSILSIWFLRPVVFLLGALLVIVLYGLSLLFRLWSLEKQKIRTVDDCLILYSSDGSEIQRLDLNSPFEVEYLFKGNGNALYQLTQGRSRIRFSAETQGAESIVKEVLRLQWPPTVFWWPLS